MLPVNNKPTVILLKTFNCLAVFLIIIFAGDYILHLPPPY